MSTIRLSDETKERLKNEGKKGDSYEDIILKTLTKKRRIKVKEVFGNECEQCKRKENLHIHHIDHDRTNNRLSNLKLLCRKCHWKLHPKPKRAFKDPNLKTKLMLDCNEELWKKVQLYKISKGLKNNNEAVVKLIDIALKMSEKYD